MLFEPLYRWLRRHAPTYPKWAFYSDLALSAAIVVLILWWVKW
jgi:hypothetical protein